MTKRKAVHSHIFFYRGFLVFIRIKSFKSRWKREREREIERERERERERENSIDTIEKYV